MGLRDGAAGPWRSVSNDLSLIFEGDPMEVFKTFTVEAAHWLPLAPEGHKCRRLHGHSFTIEIYVSGYVDPRHGWVIDFGDISGAFRPIFDQLDHYCLNEIEGLENPTSENLASWIWDRLLPTLSGLAKIIVRETCTSGCVYYGSSREEGT